VREEVVVSQEVPLCIAGLFPFERVQSLQFFRGGSLGVDYGPGASVGHAAGPAVEGMAVIVLLGVCACAVVDGRGARSSSSGRSSRGVGVGVGSVAGLGGLGGLVFLARALSARGELEAKEEAIVERRTS
jgi:hypothetical protein